MFLQRESVGKILKVNLSGNAMKGEFGSELMVMAFREEKHTYQSVREKIFGRGEITKALDTRKKQPEKSVKSLMI